MTSSDGPGASSDLTPSAQDSPLISRLISLCSIPAPSCSELPVSEFIRSYLESLDQEGIMVYEYPKESIPQGGDCADLLITVSGRAPGRECVLLCAHLDTVPVPTDRAPVVLLDDGKLHTGGAQVLGGDDRAGVAAALEMISYAAEHPQLHGGLEVLFTVQEEIGCRGSRDLDLSLIRSRYGYNLDGETPPGTLITRAPAKSTYRCTVEGRSAHAALAPSEGINAIQVAARMISQLPQGQLDEDSTANVGMICGGAQTNIIPDTVTFTGELRSFSEERFSHHRKTIDRICTEQARLAEAHVQISWEHGYSGYLIPPERQVIKRFIAACNALQIPHELLSSPGGGDSNNLNAGGLDVVVFGLGMHHIHTPDEYLLIDEFSQAVKLLARILFLP
ncbi:MAG: M20/M25/M40 family metallo-hydrolase [Spirochaetia bacterium]|nr:M20/M25/M40 family metallo-hydrolase [Spirochaetia bacterium]